MAQINWLDFLQKGQWKPQPLLKVEELKEGRQKVRDINRIRAIEEAKAKGVDASGNLDPSKIRESLFAQGFGGDADSVLNQISQARAQASDTRQASMVKDATMVQMGLMSPEQYNKKWYNTESVETVSEKPMETSWMQGIPQDVSETVSNNVPKTATSQLERFKKPIENSSDIVVEGKYVAPDSTYKLPDIPTIDRKIVKTPSQMSPEYLSESGDIGKSLFGKTPEMVSGNVSESGATFASGLTKEDEAAYKIYLARTGVDITSGNLQDQIRQRLLNVSETVAKPILTIDPKDPVKSLNDYQVALNEYPAKVAAAQQTEIERLRNIPGTIQSEQIAKRGDIRAAESEQRAKFAQEVSTDPLTPSKNSLLSRNVTSTELEKIKDYRKAYVNFQQATGTFADAVDAAIAKSKIDGSVNWDNVVGNLVSMGAWPSSDAVSLKQNLDPQVPVSKMAVLYAWDTVKDQTGKAIKPRGASQEWVNKNVKELNSALVDAGGKPFTARDQVDVKRSTKESSNTKSTGKTKSGNPVMEF